MEKFLRIIVPIIAVCPGYYLTPFNLLQLMKENGIALRHLPANFLNGPCYFEGNCRRTRRQCKFHHDDFEEDIGKVLNYLRIKVCFVFIFFCVCFFYVL